MITERASHIKVEKYLDKEQVPGYCIKPEGYRISIVVVTVSHLISERTDLNQPPEDSVYPVINNGAK